MEIFAQIPDASRYGASIVGEILGCLDRATTTHFSFYLSIPTRATATLFNLVSYSNQFTTADLGSLVFGAQVTLFLPDSVLAGYCATARRAISSHAASIVSSQTLPWPRHNASIIAVPASLGVRLTNP